MDYYRIGYIANTLGIKGELKVLSISNVPGRFDNMKSCYIDTGNGKLSLELERYRPYKGRYIALKFLGYDDIDSVAMFKGKYLEVDEGNLAELEEGHFYVFDIIGCKVLTADGESLGEVGDVLSHAGNDVYVIKGKKGDILIPAVKEIVKDIDIVKKAIKVDLPEGLVE